jgi:MerR family transcriptional regulator, Zn(II)-responsive regulator of zntA
MKDVELGPRDVARESGVSTDTLRHYERQGLLRGVRRTASGYRRYPPGTVARVLLIQRALVVGFSLDEVRQVLAVRDRGGAPCTAVRALVAERVERLGREIDELRSLHTELKRLAAEWDVRLASTPAGTPARLLETLGARPIIERTRVRRRQNTRISH